MTVYAVARIKFKDRQAYGAYEAGFMEVFAQFNGTLLGVDDEPQVLEGPWEHDRSVLISFPSTEDLMAWYTSPAYQSLAQHRWNASEGSIIMMRGF